MKRKSLQRFKQVPPWEIGRLTEEQLMGPSVELLDSYGKEDRTLIYFGAKVILSGFAMGLVIGLAIVCAYILFSGYPKEKTSAEVSASKAVDAASKVEAHEGTAPFHRPR